MKIYADAKESYFEKEIVNITIKPTGEDQTIAIGNVIILRNITVFKELDFAKTNFIATVSHELKTPISSIKMSLQLLENEATGIINEEQKHLVESIKEDSDRLLKITGELLELSQVETGNIQLNIEKSNPYEIVHYATEAVKMQAEQKQIEVLVEADENLSDIKADSEKTAWVLINFLTNAIRYSSEQSTITVKLKSDRHQVLFTVIDKGKGIDIRYRNKVFDKYFQIPGSHKTKTDWDWPFPKNLLKPKEEPLVWRANWVWEVLFTLNWRQFNFGKGIPRLISLNEFEIHPKSNQDSKRIISQIAPKKTLSQSIMSQGGSSNCQ